jgi:hypothetical protein
MLVEKSNADSCGLPEPLLEHEAAWGWNIAQTAGPPAVGWGLRRFQAFVDHGANFTDSFVTVMSYVIMIK